MIWHVRRIAIPDAAVFVTGMVAFVVVSGIVAIFMLEILLEKKAFGFSQSEKAEKLDYPPLPMVLSHRPTGLRSRPTSDVIK